MGEQEETIQRIIEGHAPPVRAIAQALRDVVREAAPDLVEEAKTGWDNIVYKGNGVVCAISPHKAHVNLNFYKGTALPDPDGLLEGTGKNLRHVKVRALEDVDAGALATLVREAVRLDET